MTQNWLFDCKGPKRINSDWEYSERFSQTISPLLDVYCKPVSCDLKLENYRRDLVLDPINYININQNYTWWNNKYKHIEHFVFLLQSSIHKLHSQRPPFWLEKSPFWLRKNTAHGIGRGHFLLSPENYHTWTEGLQYSANFRSVLLRIFRTNYV